MVSGDAGISAFPEGDSLLFWVGTVTGADGTVYEGMIFKVSLRFKTVRFSPITNAHSRTLGTLSSGQRVSLVLIVCSMIDASLSAACSAKGLVSLCRSIYQTTFQRYVRHCTILLFAELSV